MSVESRGAAALAMMFTLGDAAPAQDFAFFPVGVQDTQLLPFSTVSGISSSGETIAGTTASGSTANVAFFWTIAGGMTLIPPQAPYFLSTGAGVASDEQTVGGNLFDFVQDPDLFRRTELGGVTPIVPTPLFDGATVFAISDNGSTLVGQGNRPGFFGQFEAFKWTSSGGFQPLGDLNFQNVFMSSAQAVSASGGTVVGFALNNNLDQQAFIRTPSDGNRGLSLLPGEICCESAAFGISAGAEYVVGESDSTVGNELTKEATRWSGPLLIPEGLGFFQDATSTTALDVSAGGTVVVGRGVTGRGDVAFIWEEGVGIRDLESLLVDSGINLTGWFLEEAVGISDDGTVICGNGTHNGVSEAWVVVRLNVPPTITTQPISLIVNEGDQAMFFVEAMASEPLAFQWRREGVDLVDDARISGATTNLLTIDDALAGDFGVYDVVVSVAQSQATSDPAALCVQTGGGAGPTPPSLSADPISQVVTVGDDVVLSVVVASSPMPPTFQWRKNGAPLADGGGVSGATTASLSLMSVQTSDFGAYDCVVSSGAASVTSAPAALCVMDTTPATCAGDADGSGVVDFADITTVLNNWLEVCPSN